MSDATGLDDAQLADSQIPSDADPFALFDLWFAKARENEINTAREAQPVRPSAKEKEGH